MIDMSQMIVVLVDDDPDNLNMLHDILALQGINTIRAASGRECLALLGTVAPAAIVVDLEMPEMDGWGLLSKIRGNPATAGVPVMAITAYHSPNVAQKAIEAGFSAYLSKPIRAEEFLSRLREIAT